MGRKKSNKNTVVEEKQEINIRAILKESTDLSDDSLDAIEEAFTAAVDDRAQLRVQKALMEQDEEYTNKLNELLEAIDVDRTRKTKQMLEALDNDRAKKLKKVVQKYNKVVEEDASQFKDHLVGTISRYLDKFLLEHVPTADIQKAVKNTKAAKMVQNLREALMVDQATAIKSVRDAVVDGKQQLDEAVKRADKAEKKLKQLQERVAKAESDLFLERKTADLADDVREYTLRLLDGKSPEFIEENFDYTVQMFDKTEEERLEQLKEQAMKQRTVKAEPKESKQVLTEKTEEVIEEQTETSGYLSELSKY